MSLSDSLLCLYSARIREEPDSDSKKYIIEVPEHEVDTGSVHPGETYRVALLSPVSESTSHQDTNTQPAQDDSSHPPVEEGDLREVEITDIGEQGDGIARIDRGYVVIVPDTDIGDRVTVRITEARENVAFADVAHR